MVMDPACFPSGTGESRTSSSNRPGRNIARCEEMTGGGKEAYALAEKMSQAWINFSRAGNPNHPGLPAWPKYIEATGATMMFENRSGVRNHPDKEVLEMTMSGPSRF